MSIAFLLHAQQRGTTKIQRDSKGRIIITNTPAEPAPAPPPEEPAPATSTDLQQLQFPVPTITTTPSGMQGLKQLPFALSAGHSSTATLAFAPTPPLLSALRSEEGEIVIVRGALGDYDRNAPFPFHRPALRSIRGDMQVTVERDYSKPETPKLDVEGVSPAKERFHYYRGGPSQWKPKLKVYDSARVSTADGVDIAASGDSAVRHYHVTIAAGIDPGRVSFVFADSFQHLPDGTFTLGGSGYESATIVQPAPVAWQPVSGGEKQTVTASWSTTGPVGRMAFTPYDPQRELHVEFDIHRYAESASVDGRQTEVGFYPNGTIATDRAGNVYVAGSASFQNGRFETQGPGPSFVVQKFSPRGERMYTTLFAGAGEKIVALTPDDGGNLFVGGLASPHFPVNTPEPCEASCKGVFVTKLNPEGEIVTSAVAIDVGEVAEVAVDTNGIAYIATSSAPDWLKEAASKGFLAKADDTYGQRIIAAIDPSKKGHESVRYASHTGPFYPMAIAPARDGMFYVAGGGREGTFDPELVKAPGDHNHRVNAGFIAKIDPKLTGRASLAAWALVGVPEATSLGGAIYDVALDDHYVYAAGMVSGSGTAGSENAWNHNLRGGRDGFVARYDRELGTRHWMTLIGGSSEDRAMQVAPDGRGNVDVAGIARSVDFPQVRPPGDPSAEGITHFFLTRINALGTHANWSLLAGGASEQTERMSIASAGDAMHVAVVQTLFESEMQGSPTYLTALACAGCPQPPTIKRLEGGYGSKLKIHGSRFTRKTQVFINGKPAAKVTYKTPAILEVDRGDAKGAFEVVVANDDQTVLDVYQPVTGRIAAAVMAERSRTYLLGGAAVVVLAILALVWKRKRRKPKVAPRRFV